MLTIIMLAMMMQVLVKKKKKNDLVNKNQKSPTAQSQHKKHTLGSNRQRK